MSITQRTAMRQMKKFFFHMPLPDTFDKRKQKYCEIALRRRHPLFTQYHLTAKMCN